MTNDAARLTVVIPAFNEAARLRDRAGRLNRAAEEGHLIPRTTELIIVDDGSTDETGRCAEQILAPTFPQLRVLRLDKNAGKGAAVQVGTAAASAPVVLFLDADMSVDPSQIPDLVRAIGPAHVAIGSRAHEGSVVQTYGFKRTLMGRTFNAMVGTLTDVPFRDTQCGFKAFRTSMARVLFHLMQVKRFAFDVELLYLARKLRMEVSEVPVRWSEVGESRVSSFRDPFHMTRDVLRLRARREWPSLPGLTVAPAKGERRRSQSRIAAEVHAALGSNYPILRTSPERMMVLLPLRDPSEMQSAAARLRRLPTKLEVYERSVSFQQLLDLMPFEWVDDEQDGFVVASGFAMSPLVTRRPTGGWEAMRDQPVRCKKSRIGA